MAILDAYPLPQLHQLPRSMPDDGAIDIVLEDGIPIFRASKTVQKRIQTLLAKNQSGQLTPVENEELDRYEEIDDYLSHLNRLVRNLRQTPSE